MTEFRRAATTYPNALSSPLNYPFSSHVLLFSSPRRSLKPRSHFTPFPDSSPKRARAPRYRTSPGNFSTGEEENTVVTRRSKFPWRKSPLKDDIERAGGSEDVRRKNTWRHEDLQRTYISMYGAANLFGKDYLYLD